MILYFDFESFLFQPGCQAPPIVCMSYAEDDGPRRLLHANFQRAEMHAVLDRALSSGHLVAYNGASTELLFMAADRPHTLSAIVKACEEGRVHDPFLMEKLARIAKGDHRVVGNLAQTLDDHMIKHAVNKQCRWRMRYGELWSVPVEQWPQEAIAYSLDDLAVRELYISQVQRFDPAWLVNERERVMTGFVLSLTSAHGFPVDGAAADALYERTQARLDKHKADLLAAGLLRAEPDPDKPGAVKFVRTKSVAEPRLVAAYAAKGRPAPRGDLSPKMLTDAYLEAGLPPPQVGKKVSESEIDEALDAGVPEELLQGNYSLDEESCKNSGDPLLLAYAEYGQANTLLAKVRRLGRAARAGKPIQTYYDSLKNTGRTSSSTGDDPKPGEAYSSFGAQVQNLDRAGEEKLDESGKKVVEWGLRECFVAPGYTDWLARTPSPQEFFAQNLGRFDLMPDEVIVSVDLDSAEMRGWAQCCKWILGYSALAEILNNPKRCPHIEMGTLLYDKAAASTSWEERYAWGYGLKKTDKALLKKVRNLAKGPNFGLPGGMGWERLQDYCYAGYGVSLSEEQARGACKTWRLVYPEAQPYLDHISENVLKGKRGLKAKGTIVQFVSKRVRGGVGFCDAANGYFQALIADAATAAGWELMKACYLDGNSPLFGCRILGFVHDEWLLAVPRRRLHEAGHEAARIIVDVVQTYHPDVLITASPAGFYRWSKAAGDPLYLKDGKLSSLDAGGELVPYEEVAALLAA